MISEISAVQKFGNIDELGNRKGEEIKNTHLRVLFCSVCFVLVCVYKEEPPLVYRMVCKFFVKIFVYFSKDFETLKSFKET